MSHPIKRCLIIRAMLPQRFPHAFDQLVRKLKDNAAAGGSRIEPCRCAPPCGKFTLKALSRIANSQGVVPQPTEKQVAALTDRVAKTKDAALIKEFLALFKVPDQNV